MNTRNAEQDDEGLDERFELGRHDDVDQEDRQQQRVAQAALAGLHLALLTRDLDLDPVRR